jgi:hypothetical protein
MKKYDNNIKKVFELLSLNNDYRIIGSAKNNLFFSDYDMNSLLNYKGKNIETKLYKEFLNIFKVVEKNDELWKLAILKPQDLSFMGVFHDDGHHWDKYIILFDAFKSSFKEVDLNFLDKEI